jgi:PAS domain S-box-containing protein
VDGTSTKRQIRTGFLIAVITLAALSVAIFSTMTGRKHLDAAMENKNSSILAMGNLIHSLDEVESVQDAFMLAADSNALFARTRAVRDVQSRLDELQSTDVTMYRQLNTSITDTIHALDAELSLYTKSGMQSVTQSGMPVRLLQQRQQSHDLANALISTVKAEMQSLRIQSSRNTVTLYILQIAIILLALGVLIWSVILMRSELRERQQKENQLRDINAYVESLLENIPAMIFIKDARDLRFVRINKAGESLLGISREEFVGKSDHDFFPPDQVEFFINKDREVLAQDKVVEIPEETIDTRNHGQRWLHTLKVPVMNVDKKPLLLLGISMDITTQKLAEQRIKALNVELEQKAKQLKVSNSELETFCYSVSHDLRAPLRTIEGFAQLLEENQRSSLDADSLRYLNTIRRSSKQMSQLIDDLLAYSKMGRQTITTEKLDMNLLAARATEIAAFGRNPRPEIIIDDLPNITGDETMISSVWLNLIDNAIKYSAKNIMPRIHISARSDDHTITYCVQDNGVGFDMQQYDKLFDVFQRLHSEREFTGTGLGLAIVERIISRHGGRVWAEGTPQQGATFYFSLSTEPAHALS